MATRGPGVWRNLALCLSDGGYPCSTWREPFACHRALGRASGDSDGSGAKVHPTRRARVGRTSLVHQASTDLRGRGPSRSPRTLQRRNMPSPTTDQAARASGTAGARPVALSENAPQVVVASSLSQRGMDSATPSASTARSSDVSSGESSTCATQARPTQCDSVNRRASGCHVSRADRSLPDASATTAREGSIVRRATITRL